MHDPSIHCILYNRSIHIIYAQGDSIVAQETILPRQASMMLIPRIDELLVRNKQTVHTIAYISCSRGPGSFTSIRSLIVTVNGLSTVCKIPLIGLIGTDYDPASAVAYAYTLFKAGNDLSYRLLPLYTNDLETPHTPAPSPAEQ